MILGMRLIYNCIQCSYTSASFPVPPPPPSFGKPAVGTSCVSLKPYKGCTQNVLEQAEENSTPTDNTCHKLYVGVNSVQIKFLFGFHDMVLCPFLNPYMVVDIMSHIMGQL